MLAMDRITDPDRYREARVHVHVQCHNDFKFDIAQHAMMPPGSTWPITSAHVHGGGVTEIHRAAPERTERTERYRRYRSQVPEAPQGRRGPPGAAGAPGAAKTAH